MKRRRWLTAGVVVLVLAAAVAGWLLLRPRRVTLYDYARSLPDDSFFVSTRGKTYRLNSMGAEGEAFVTADGGVAGPEVELKTEKPDRNLTPWEYAEHIDEYAVLRQDGTIWTVYNRRIPEGEDAEIAVLVPFLRKQEEELPLEENGFVLEAEQFAQDVFTCLLRLPEGTQTDKLSWTLYVRLGDVWYRLSCGGLLGGGFYSIDQEDPDRLRHVQIIFRCYDNLIYPGTTVPPPGQAPQGSYRLEIYEDGVCRLRQDMELDYAKSGVPTLTGQ